MASQPIPRLTEAEYLAIEEKAEYKSEFYNGEMFAMSGSSFPHCEVEMALSYEVGARLKGSRCRSFNSNLRVKAGNSTLYTYPDLTVVCGEPQLLTGKTATLLNPIVIFEILSPSTEGYDRGKKFLLYRSIESLQQYVLVSQEAPEVEVRTRNADQSWTTVWYQGMEAVCQIAAAGISIPLAAIYERVNFESGT